MTIVADDPLIAGMAIDGSCPCTNPAGVCASCIPNAPRVYGVAVMSDLTRRRWWPLQEALSTDRLAGMFGIGALEMDSPVAAAQQLAATLAHVVIGRVIPLLVLEGRAWDTGLENLWVHVDSEGVIDWVGVVDPTLRALPDDVFFRVREERRDGSAREKRAARFAKDGMVRLPSEAALTIWVAHRSHRALQPLFGKIHDVSGGAISMASMWHIVGAAVVGAATHVPLLAGSSEVTSLRRGQAVLDSLVSFGLPVRGGSRLRQGKALLN
jgi:hypothetical protein